jgi:hypothetical protein
VLAHIRALSTVSYNNKGNIKIKKMQNINPNTKVQIAAICEELTRHTSAIDSLISDEGPVSNLVIQGHMEAHLEKIEDSIEVLSRKYGIKESQLIGTPLSELTQISNKMETQRQGMKLLQSNIKKLDAKVRHLLPKTAQRTGVPRFGPLRELSRKLKNDLCRTSYLLQ